MKRRRVADFPKYLLTGIPPDERGWLSEQAATQNVSVSDVVRGLLCARYHLACPPESYRYEPARDQGALTILLRIQPKLQAALEREAARTGHSKRQIILEAITSRKQKGELS